LHMGQFSVAILAAAGSILSGNQQQHHGTTRAHTADLKSYLK
jgi:hypothetical protein